MESALPSLLKAVTYYNRQIENYRNNELQILVVWAYHALSSVISKNILRSIQMRAVVSTTAAAATLHAI